MLGATDAKPKAGNYKITAVSSTDCQDSTPKSPLLHTADTSARTSLVSPKLEDSFHSLQPLQIEPNSSTYTTIGVLERGDELSPDLKRSCLSRTFGPLTQGSIRSSVLSLVSTCMGAGVLVLPYAMSQAGIINGIICIIICGLIARWMMGSLIVASFRTNSRLYSEIVEKSLNKTQSRVFQCIFIMYIFGTILNLQIISVTFITDFLAHRVHIAEGFALAAKQVSTERTILVLIINACIIFPISCARNMYKLRHVSLIVVSAVVYTLIVILVEAPEYFRANYTDQEPSTKKIVYTCFHPSLFSTFAVMFLSYDCNSNLFNVKNELVNPIERRVMKICNRTIAVDMLIYTIFGTVAYLCFLDDTDAVVTRRHPLNADSYDLAMNFGRILFCLSTMCAVAIRINPCRKQIAVFLNKGENLSAPLHYTLTFLLVICSATICVLMPNVYTAFTIIGGYGATLMAITYPGVLFLKNATSQETIRKAITKTITVVGTCLGFAAATLSILKLLNIYTPTGCEGNLV